MQHPDEAHRVAATVAEFLSAPLAAWFDARFVRSDRLIDEYTSRLTLQVAKAVGLDETLAGGGTAEELVARLHLNPEAALVPIGWILRRLAERGVIVAREAGDGPPRFRAEHALPGDDPAVVRAEQERHDPASLPSYALADTAAQMYPAFLAGKRSGEDILLGPARLGLWSRYFSNEHPLYAVNNRLAAAAVMSCLGETPSTILELGGGLGSATAAVLDALLAADRVDDVAAYRVTELAPMFLRTAQRRAETHYPTVPWLTFATLDIDQPFAPQGIAPESVSIVYAVNTLHVSRDLTATLGEIRRALRPGGCLVAGECVRPRAGETVYPEFVFNLLTTFRAPALHPGYRPNGGFLTPEQWREALGTAGFRDVRTLPDMDVVRAAVPRFSVAALIAS
jgi:SAM-dependent methyltransferase